MSDKVRWGVLGVARIATEKVIPAMQRSPSCEIVAIASRDLEKARGAASALGIARAYGSYEELLADPGVDAIYNPLPNHLHVPWSIRTAEAGKHVLVEKPVSLNVAECRTLIEARDRTGVKIGEAFMVRTHPQWIRARDLARSGEIGRLRAIVSAFSFYGRDPSNVRNILEYGGGGLMDLGCYAVQVARYFFGAEPQRVVSLIERDPEMRIDSLASVLLDFPSGQSLFTCSMQMFPYQRVQIVGDRGRIEIEIPFNAPPDRPTRIFVHTAAGPRTEEFPICDQYGIQGELFSKAVRGEGDVPTPIEDSIRNMAVLDAIFESERTGGWARPSNG
jgi:predicted dehydrogenase